MEHHFVHVLGRIVLKTFTPIVADPVRENRTVSIEIGGRDGTTYGRIALEPMVCVFIPKMERPVGPGGAERPKDWMERYGIDGVNIDCVVHGRVAVAAKGEVEAVLEASALTVGYCLVSDTHPASFSSKY